MAIWKQQREMSSVLNFPSHRHLISIISISFGWMMITWPFANFDAVCARCTGWREKKIACKVASYTPHQGANLQPTLLTFSHVTLHVVYLNSFPCQPEHSVTLNQWLLHDSGFICISHHWKSRNFRKVNLHLKLTREKYLSTARNWIWNQGNFYVYFVGIVILCGNHNDRTKTGKIST